MSMYAATAINIMSEKWRLARKKLNEDHYTSIESWNRPPMSERFFILSRDDLNAVFVLLAGIASNVPDFEKELLVVVYPETKEGSLIFREVDVLHVMVDGQWITLIGPNGEKLGAHSVDVIGNVREIATDIVVETMNHILDYEEAA